VSHVSDATRGTPTKVTVPKTSASVHTHTHTHTHTHELLLVRQSTGYATRHYFIPNTKGTGQLKCDGTRADTRFRLSAKRTSPFKSAGASVQSITGSRGVRISGSNAGYTMFRGNVKGTGYLLHSPVSPSLPLPRVTVCHHISLEST